MNTWVVIVLIISGVVVFGIIVYAVLAVRKMMNDSIKKTTLRGICLTMDYIKTLAQDATDYERAFECVNAIRTLADAYAMVEGRKGK